MGEGNIIVAAMSNDIHTYIYWVKVTSLLLKCRADPTLMTDEDVRHTRRVRVRVRVGFRVGFRVRVRVGFRVRIGSLGRVCNSVLR